ncbi:MAG: hypothetical protein GY801_25645 [bacterium]|nr:hypothetical protein [bacterium]
MFLAEIDVKIFGGASLIRSRQGGKRVGELKIEVAHRMIEGNGLNLLSKHPGGDAGRTLYFYSDTGEVYLKRHKSSRIVPEELRTENRQTPRLSAGRAIIKILTFPRKHFK